MMSHVGNCLKLTLITLISFNHQTPLMPLWFVTVLLRSTACLWHHLPHLVRTTERLVKHGQTMSTVLSVFSCRIMSYCKYDTVSSWEPKHAKTPSPFGVMRYQVSTLTAFKIWTGCHVILPYLYISYIMFLIFKSCFWEFGSLMVTGDMWNVSTWIYDLEATKQRHIPIFHAIPRSMAVASGSSMPRRGSHWGSHCISRKDHQEIINLSTSFNFKPCSNECKFKSHRP